MEHRPDWEDMDSVEWNEMAPDRNMDGHFFSGLFKDVDHLEPNLQKDYGPHERMSVSIFDWNVNM
jgi:hypothetical protein